MFWAILGSSPAIAEDAFFSVGPQVSWNFGGSSSAPRWTFGFEASYWGACIPCDEEEFAPPRSVAIDLQMDEKGVRFCLKGQAWLLVGLSTGPVVGWSESGGVDLGWKTSIWEPLLWMDLDLPKPRDSFVGLVVPEVSWTAGMPEGNPFSVGGLAKVVALDR